jgi:hypothetical protein
VPQVLGEFGQPPAALRHARRGLELVRYLSIAHRQKALVSPEETQPRTHAVMNDGSYG